ncbi:MAG TPA: YceI family protein [Caulobacteraceae bacterium]|jgi:polyisoprenoid-binding protein YceI|nr:YceI family protein [Caulobacteraceae bacterium]
MRSKVFVRALAFGAAASLALTAAASAQTMPTASHDFHAAPAGKYAIDPKHTGLIARVPHVGFSYSIFRFQGVTGAMVWDPAKPASDTLSVSVDAKSIATAPVDGFSAEIDDRFLKATNFPVATFTSTRFHPTSATHGTVEGDLVLMGVTKHVVFDVDLVGAGVGMGHHPVLGVTARTTLDPKAYGLPGFITGPIELVIDTEFDGQS